MAYDVLPLNAGSGGHNVAVDTISSKDFQRVKITFGAEGFATDVSTAAPLPTTLGDGTNYAALTNTTPSGSAYGIVVRNLPSGTQNVSVLTGAAEVGKAEDFAAATGDAGIPAMAIRKATPANTSDADGDYEMLQISAGRLWVSALIDTALPAGTNAIGKLVANAGVTIGAVEIAAGQTLGTVTSITNVVHVDDNSSTLSVDDGSGSLTFDYATTGHGVASGALRVELPTDGTGVIAAVTNIAQFGGVAISLNTGVRDAGTQRVTIATNDSLAVTNAGTFLTQENGAALTSLQLIDDVVYAEDLASTSADKGIFVLAIRRDSPVVGSGTDGDYSAFNVDATGRLYVTAAVDTALPAGSNAIGKLAANAGVTIGAVELASAQTLAALTSITNVVHVDDNAGSLTVDNAGTFAVQATIAAGASSIAKAEDVASADGDVGIPAMAVRKSTPANTSGTDGDYEMLQISAGRLWASVVVDTALPAGTNAIGKLAVNAGVTIGAVELAASQTLATLTTITNVVHIDDNSGSVTIDGTITASNTAGDIAHDGADSGNPVKVGGKAVNAFPSAVSNGDRANFLTDLYGRQLTATIDPAQQIYKSFNTTSTATGTAIWTPAGGKRIVVTSVLVSTYATTAARVILWFGASGDTTYTEGTDQPLLKASFAPTTTSNPGTSPPFPTPIFCATADYILRITTSAGVSVDVVVYGYEIT